MEESGDFGRRRSSGPVENQADTRPGASNACYECGSTEHFGYNCKKRVARLAREEEKRAGKKRATEKAEKDE